MNDLNGLRRCGVLTRAGTPCRATALPGEERCFCHSPRYAEKLRAGRTKAGQITGRRRRLGRLETLNLSEPGAALEQIALALVGGKIGADEARALATLVKTKLETVDMRAFEGRLRKIEEARL